MDKISEMREHMREDASHMLGISDTSGLEIVSLLHIVEHQYDAIGKQHSGNDDVSEQRWALLMRLRTDERHGNAIGLTPTNLSRMRHVSKNTISSLIRGLEEQGLVERLLDPADHRLFLIKLTPKGRDFIDMTVPEHIAYLNKLASGLSKEERIQLADLLAKLYRSMMEQSQLNEVNIEEELINEK
jgi:DNA-binding MarR family transcriptional regulator